MSKNLRNVTVSGYSYGSTVSFYFANGRYWEFKLKHDADPLCVARQLERTAENIRNDKNLNNKEN